MTTSALFETRLRVIPEWIDPNGHLHDANYLHVFNMGVKDLFSELEIGILYGREGHTIFNLGMCIDYVKELLVDEPVRVTMQIVDWDHKRLHLYSEMRHGDTGELCATAERLFMNISKATRRSTPFYPEAYARIEACGKAHVKFGRPQRLGRTLGIRRAAVVQEQKEPSL